MEQIAFTMQLKAGKGAEYQQRHDAIWPELLALFSDAGVRDYSIFLDAASGRLFAVLRRTKEHGMDSLAQHRLMRRWWTHMADLMETKPDFEPVVVPLLPVFHVD